MNGDAARPDPARPDPARPDPARPDPARPDPARPDPVRPDAAAPADAADDLQFGEVRDRGSATPPLAPGLNGHLAIAEVVRTASGGKRRSAAGPTEVFVDLDTFLDMQEHAAEDTSIELGGILLGRRGESQDGRPWVMICDSLRARHYRATRGSFKFTHETWADLNRRRSELPESTEIVGWYHTHPGWGVFLSDQDVFICDHFFAHPDDVALVIEPTSGDTGLFVRRDSPGPRPPQRLGTYRLYAHRKRRAELHAWASFFSGVGTMSNPPAVFPPRHSTPVVVTTGSDPSGTAKWWGPLGGALLGAQLAILFAILLILAFRGSPAGAIAEEDTLRVREAIADDLLGIIAVEGPDEAIRSWRETELANAQLRAANLGLLSRVDALTGDLQAERLRSKQTDLEVATVREQLGAAETSLAALATDPLAESKAGFRVDWKLLLAGCAASAVLGWFACSLRRGKLPLLAGGRAGGEEPQSFDGSGNVQ